MCAELNSGEVCAFLQESLRPLQCLSISEVLVGHFLETHGSGEEGNTEINGCLFFACFSVLALKDCSVTLKTFVRLPGLIMSCCR